MFITSARVKLWKFSKPIPTSSALAMAARLRSNSMATSFQPVVFSLGNPPLLAPLIPVQKTTPKKSKNRPLPPQKKISLPFQSQKLSENTRNLGTFRDVRCSKPGGTSFPACSSTASKVSSAELMAFTWRRFYGGEKRLLFGKPINYP